VSVSFFGFLNNWWNLPFLVMLGLVGVFSYGLYLIHQPYVIWLGLRIRNQPIWMFLLIFVATVAVLSTWGVFLEKTTNTLVSKLFPAKKRALA